MADEEQAPKEQHWLLRLAIFAVLFLDLLFIILLQGFNLELGLAGMLFALILLVLKEKKPLKKKFEKIKVLNFGRICP